MVVNMLPVILASLLYTTLASYEDRSSRSYDKDRTSEYGNSGYDWHGTARVDTMSSGQGYNDNEYGSGTSAVNPTSGGQGYNGNSGYSPSGVGMSQSSQSGYGNQNYANSQLTTNGGYAQPASGYGSLAPGSATVSTNGYGGYGSEATGVLPNSEGGNNRETVTVNGCLFDTSLHSFGGADYSMHLIKGQKRNNNCMSYHVAKSSPYEDKYPHNLLSSSNKGVPTYISVTRIPGSRYGFVSLKKGYLGKDSQLKLSFIPGESATIDNEYALYHFVILLCYD